MKNILILYLLLFFLTSCEDVIAIDTPSAAPRLVIDASINWFKGTMGNEQKIKLSLTSPYFDQNIPKATEAKVKITDSHGHSFNFLESDPGLYLNSDFIPEINGQYTLQIQYQGETYTATETLQPSPKLGRVEQTNNVGFSDDETEIKAFFQDPAGEDNYYYTNLIRFDKFLEAKSFQQDVIKDEFIDGNEIYTYYADEDISPNDELTIQLFGISKSYYEYLFLLFQQDNDESRGPYSTLPATVRGNCVNQNNRENYPLGYFRLSEADEVTYIVE